MICCLTKKTVFLGETMKPIIKQRVLVVWIFTLLVSPIVSAGIVDLGNQLGTKLQEIDYTFGPISVTSMVYEMGDQYLYTYELTNPQGSTDNASWFSVAIQSGVDILSIGYDTSSTLIVPAVWHNVGDPIISVDAQFQDPITPGDVSTILYFFSAQGPSTTTASVGGSTQTGGSFVYMGLITSPVPEPATVLLLAAGAFFGLRRKR